LKTADSLSVKADSEVPNLTGRACAPSPALPEIFQSLLIATKLRAAGASAEAPIVDFVLHLASNLDIRYRHNSGSGASAALKPCVLMFSGTGALPGVGRVRFMGLSVRYPL